MRERDVRRDVVDERKLAGDACNCEAIHLYESPIHV